MIDIKRFLSLFLVCVHDFTYECLSVYFPCFFHCLFYFFNRTACHISQFSHSLHVMCILHSTQFGCYSE